MLRSALVMLRSALVMLRSAFPYEKTPFTFLLPFFYPCRMWISGEACAGCLLSAPASGGENDPGQPSGFASELAGRAMRPYLSASQPRGLAGVGQHQGTRGQSAEAQTLRPRR